MKINEIDINSYGNIEKKTIKLDNEINIIHGNNEAGKSTLLNCIISMLYGISKTKDNKEISDYEKYKPWSDNEFSAKMKYTLDNRKQYEVFRDFNKKNPKIYNENYEDISNSFNVNKKEGNQFFIDQAGLEKNTYLSTIITTQGEVKLAKEDQNSLVQRIANIAGSGEDNTSYEKADKKLKEILNEEIGTTRTKDKPLNIVDKQIEDTKIKLRELQSISEEQYEILNNKEIIMQNIKELSEKEIMIRELNEAKEKQTLYETKIQEKEKSIKESNNQINNLEKDKNERIIKSRENKESGLNKIKQQEDKNYKKDKVYVIISIVLLLITLLSFVVIKSNIIGVFFSIIFIMSVVLSIMQIKNNKMKLTENSNNNQINNEVDEDIVKIKGQIELLSKNVDKMKKELEVITQEYNALKESIKEKITNKYIDKIDNDYIKYLFSLNNLKQELDEKQKEINENKLSYRKIELEEDNITPKIENKIKYEEELKNLENRRNELKEKEIIINRTKDFLEIAYNKMKTQVTPKFTNNLSNNIEKISNNKYNKVTINDEKGLIVEQNNGEYVDISRLSMGTIDELYLALRISMVNEMCKEKLPIMFDEVFAYFDNIRMKSTLEYISKEFLSNQIIIFTCTNREVDCLKELNIKYNLIEL